MWDCGPCHLKTRLSASPLERGLENVAKAPGSEQSSPSSLENHRLACPESPPDRKVPGFPEVTGPSVTSPGSHRRFPPPFVLTTWPHIPLLTQAHLKTPVTQPRVRLCSPAQHHHLAPPRREASAHVSTDTVLASHPHGEGHCPASQPQRHPTQATWAELGRCNCREGTAESLVHPNPGVCLAQSRCSTSRMNE